MSGGVSGDGLEGDSPKGNGAGRRAVVVGAGMIGVCCALFLQRDGHRVTLIDRGGPGEGASFGNGSMLTSEAVVPTLGQGEVIAEQVEAVEAEMETAQAQVAQAQFEAAALEAEAEEAAAEAEAALEA